MRILMMGFDGLGYSPARFSPIGNLLNLRTLYAPLHITGPSWTSLYTGLSAKQHGVRDAWGKATNGSRTLQSSAQHLFWKRLKQELGMRISLCFLPLVKPEWSGADFCVEGFPVDSRENGPRATPKNVVYGAELLAETDIAYWPGSSVTPAEWAQPLRRKYTVEDMVTKVRRGCFLEADWWLAHGVEGADFGFIGFMVPDHPAHVWPWQWADILLPMLAELIEYLVDEINPQTTMVVSDHGFCMDGTGHTHAGVFGYSGMSYDPPTRANILHNWSVPSLVFKELGLVDEIHRKSQRELSEGELKHIQHRLKELGYIE